jgi:hypothetical protein
MFRAALTSRCMDKPQCGPVNDAAGWVQTYNPAGGVLTPGLIIILAGPAATIKKQTGRG